VEKNGRLEKFKWGKKKKRKGPNPGKNQKGKVENVKWPKRKANRKGKKIGINPMGGGNKTRRGRRKITDGGRWRGDKQEARPKKKKDHKDLKGRIVGKGGGGGGDVPRGDFAKKKRVWIQTQKRREGKGGRKKAPAPKEKNKIEDHRSQTQKGNAC